MSIDPENESTDFALNEIESALGSLNPARSRINRDLIMYRAGLGSSSNSKRKGRPWLQPWPVVAAALALIATGEAVMLALRPEPRVVERLVVIHEPIPIPPPQSANQVSRLSRPQENSTGFGPHAYDRLADQLIRYGLDGLPAAPAVAAWGNRQSASSRSMLEEELRKAAFPGDPS